MNRLRPIAVTLVLAAIAPFALPSVVPAGAQPSPPPVTYHLQPDDSVSCAPPTAGTNPTTMTAAEVICVPLVQGVEIVEPSVLELDADPAAGWARLEIPDGFEWDEQTLPRAEASFVVRVTAADGTSEDSTVELGVRPDARLAVDFTSPAPREDSDGGTLDGSGTEATGSVPGPTPRPDGAQPVGLGPAGLIKTITIEGRDRELSGLRIREQTRRGDFEIVVDGEIREPTGDAESIDFAPADGRFTYELELAESANFGRGQVTQRSELVLDVDGEEDVVLDTLTTLLALNAPLVVVDVRAPAEVEGGESTLVSVLVINQREAVLDGPLEIVVRPVEDEFVDEITTDDTVGVEVDGTTVVWSLDSLQGTEQVVRSVEVVLESTSEGAVIEWEGLLRRPQAENPIETAKITTNVPASEAEDNVISVDFTNDQMVRLIAFVTAFAIVAVIFGAWSRRTPGPGETISPEAQAREVELFRAFTESILVLVILVAILVLALQRSLSGESAASLIGVIAGYALGRSVGGSR